MATGGLGTDPQLHAVEQWFVARGLPHFIGTDESAWDIWSRAIPLLVLGYLALGMNALDLANYSVWRNVLAALFVLFVLAAVWVATNLARDRPAFARPTRVGPVELVVLLGAPMLPSALLGQWSDVLWSAIGSACMLVVVWSLTSYGILAIARWAFGRSRSQLAEFSDVIFRALPLLLMTTTFLFINAEVWQVAGRLAGIVYWIVLAVFFVLGATFLLTKVPALVRQLATFDTWSDISSEVNAPGAPPEAAELLAVEQRAGQERNSRDPDSALPTPPRVDLRPRQRVNVALVALFPQAILITAAALALTTFFVAFGALAIPADTVAAWTGEPNVNQFAAWTLGGRTLSLNEPLVRVAGFLGAFSGMYFTVVISTDATYREEFADDIGPQLRQALAVRVVYRGAIR